MNLDRVTLSHGGGGRLMHELIEKMFVSKFSNPALDEMNDSAVIEPDPGSARLAFTIDSFVVDPYFFPGGDIGKLAVCGTVNDLAVQGAKPLFLAASFILEEGFPGEDLERIVASMAETAEAAGVEIVTGDTKVVERGSCDKLFLTTAGIGTVRRKTELTGRSIEPGDKIILNGFIGDHGIAVLSSREGLKFSTGLVSDCAPLGRLVGDMLAESPKIKWMRDPTRGGVAATLNEAVSGRDFGIKIEKKKIPVRREVRGACEMLGFDPLYIANEGKIAAIVSEDAAPAVLGAMRRNEDGADSVIIGEVVSEPAGMVILETEIGGSAILDMPRGELLPRIC